MSSKEPGKNQKGSSFSSSSSGQQKQQQKKSGDSKNMTLGSLLKYMEGYEIIVELKTGKRHRGCLLSADDNMNVILKQEEKEQHNNSASATSEKSNNQILSILPQSSIHIRGSKIRYIHFPDNANLHAIMGSGRERERNAAKKYQKTRRTNQK